jgi:hypothetical protein
LPITFLGLDVRPENGVLPETAATLAMDWDVFQIGKGTVNLQLVANYQDESVSISTTQGPTAVLPSLPRYRWRSISARINPVLW